MSAPIEKPRGPAAKRPEFLVEWEPRSRAFWDNLRALFEGGLWGTPVAPASPHGPTAKMPQFLLAWESRPRAFWRNLRTVFQSRLGPVVIPAQLRTVRAAWLAPRFSWRPMLASLLLHVLVFVLPIPLFSDQPRGPVAVLLPDEQLTWYHPSDVLPPIAPLSKEKKKPSPGGKPNEPLPPMGAEGFHPRQTIISNPPKPNNKLLTLQQPDLPSPLEVKPKPLPNIVLWARSPLPPVPQLELAVKKIARPKVSLPIPKPEELPANLEPRIADINIGKSAVKNLSPRLVVPPARTATATAPGEDAEAPPTDLPVGAGEADRLRRIIALSASPAPLAPVIEVPPGNLAAQFSIGPMGVRAGSPGGIPGGTLSAQGGTGGGPGGMADSEAGGALIQAPDILVSSVPGSPPGLMAGATGPEGEARPIGPPAARSPMPAVAGERREIAHISTLPRSIVGREELKQPPPGIEQSILSGKQVYTLSINMPNLASRSGSWVVRFAELVDKNNSEKSLGNGETSELIGPIAVLKIDPKYSAETIRERVEGQVVLYAIIGKDGKVSSVHVLRGLDARLDQNAVEAFRHWEFAPAKRAGVPVDLEAVVFIPFRLAEAF